MLPAFHLVRQVLANSRQVRLAAAPDFFMRCHSSPHSCIFARGAAGRVGGTSAASGLAGTVSGAGIAGTSVAGRGGGAGGVVCAQTDAPKGAAITAARANTLGAWRKMPVHFSGLKKIPGNQFLVTVFAMVAFEHWHRLALYVPSYFTLNMA